jgi:hypothetical protein
VTLPLSYSRGSFPVHYNEIKNVPQGLKPSVGQTRGTAKAVPFVQILLPTSDRIKNVPQGLKPSVGQTRGTAKAVPFVQILLPTSDRIKNAPQGLKPS